MAFIEGQDFCFIYPKDDSTILHIKLLSGKYKDTLFKYGKVKFEEKDGQFHLIFSYDVLETTVMKPKKLEKDEDFKNHIGDLLVELISIDFDFEETYDEFGNDDPENPYL
jgi:hypothetical protein